MAMANEPLNPMALTKPKLKPKPCIKMFSACVLDERQLSLHEPMGLDRAPPPAYQTAVQVSQYGFCLADSEKQHRHGGSVTPASHGGSAAPMSCGGSVGSISIEDLLSQYLMEVLPQVLMGDLPLQVLVADLLQFSHHVFPLMFHSLLRKASYWMITTLDIPMMMFFLLKVPSICSLVVTHIWLLQDLDIDEVSPDEDDRVAENVQMKHCSQLPRNSYNCSLSSPPIELSALSSLFPEVFVQEVPKPVVCLAAMVLQTAIDEYVIMRIQQDHQLES
ncbi:hypothetical protein EDC04DRAFT_2600223 [Pisolithus marmoratus]|nr:hypothetical protein EDC04DRAFT_2600223 [Pisolithus marmoratus]